MLQRGLFFFLLLFVILGLCCATPTTTTSTIADKDLLPTPQENVAGNNNNNNRGEEVKLVELGSKQKKLLLAVVSAPKHFKAREAIRNTWATTAKARGIDVKIFIGKISPKIADHSAIEAKIKNEPMIVRFSHFEESYHTLVEKAISIFSYAVENGYDGVMKVDDDSFVHVDELVSVLSSKDWDDLWAGKFIENNAVGKNPKSKWYAYDQYPHETWPKYPSGTGFFLGTKAIKHIHDNQNSLPRIRVDDAAVGVWVQPLHLTSLPLSTNTYRFHLLPHAILDNPLTHTEQERRFQNKDEDFVIRACVEPPTDCLCADNPNVSKERKEGCWAKFKEMEYEDLVPRVVVEAEGEGML